jgi:PEP-CTERM motif
MKKLLALSLLTISAVTCTATAALVTNGDFSSGMFANNAFGDTSNSGFNNIQSWTASGLSGYGFWGTNLSSGSNQPGIGITNFAYLGNAALTSEALATTAGTNLRLSIDARTDVAASTVTLSLVFFNGGNSNGTLSSAPIALPGSNTSLPFVPINFDVIVPANTTGVAARVSTTGGIIFDNVDISVIPEPTTLAALGLAAVTLLRRKRGL